MPDLTARRREPEIMDDPSLERLEHERALRALARVHVLTGLVRQLWRRIRRQLANGRPLTLLDVGCGDAWLLRRLGRWAKRAGAQVRLVGCDFSQQALEIAEQAARREETPLELHQVDVTRDELPRGDVVTCSLFLHHFSDDEVVAILEKLGGAAGGLLLIEDLLRSQMGYAYCWLGVQLISRSPVVHTDGLISVRAAFTIAEIWNLLESAGLDNAKVVKHWPERFMIQWSPAEGGDRK